MKKSTILCLLSLLSVRAFPQGTEMREVPSFNRIEIRSSALVYLRQDSGQSLKVSSDEPLNKVITSVSDGTLIIDGSGDGELYISAPAIRGISIGGKGVVTSQSILKTGKLDLDIAGSGKMILQVEVQELNSSISGVGKMTLSGTAEQTRFDISGSGKVDALELRTRDCRVNISGNGKCLIDVTENLVTNISGNGSVKYKTTPKNMTENVSGVGKISEYSTGGGTMDTTRLNFGKSQVIIIGEVKEKYVHHKRIKPVWQGFEMGFNNYVNSSGKFELPAEYAFLELREEKSVSVGLNIVQKNVQLGKSNIWFFTGLGITWNNYHFGKNVTLYPTSPITATIDTSSNVYHIKSKLTASYLVAPFMFEAFTSRNPKKAFHFGVGALVGLRLMSHTKQKSELDGNTFKPKVYDEFGLNPFRVGTRIAIGIHRLNLFADYYFTPLFSSGEGPKLFPVNFGITLLGF